MTPRLPPAESLTVEFKSDRKRLSDHDLVEAIVCLANAALANMYENPLPHPLAVVGAVSPSLPSPSPLESAMAEWAVCASV